MIPPAWRPRLEFAAKSFIVVAFLGSLAAGVLRLHEKALADPEYRVDLGAWSVAAMPDWCTNADVRGIRDATRLAGWHASLLHPGAGSVVWRSLELAPQVVRVAAMRKTWPNRFEAVLEVRRPVAAVRTQAGRVATWVEVDDEGVVLGTPSAQRPVRAGAPVRQIVGASGAMPAVGARFDTDVCEAAGLVAELDRFGTAEDRALLATLDEIDVTNFGGRASRTESEIVLRASSPASAPVARRPVSCNVEWGRARAVDAYDPEPAFGAKAARVVQSLRMFPGLAGLRTVRVAFDDLAVVPLPGSPLAPTMR